MVPKAVLVLVAIFSWVATAAITLTVLTFGPGTPGFTPGVTPGVTPGTNPPGVSGTNQSVTLQPIGDEQTPAAALPRYNLIPVFSLTNQQGQPFGLNDLRGKIWVVDTIFTRCTAICPTLASGMKQIQSALALDPSANENVRLISISIDGDHDTPDVLKQYAKGFQADPDRWLFLTGKPADVWPLIQDGLKLPVEAGQPGDEMNILHSGKMLLIDRAGVIRGYYDGLTEAGRIELIADLARLLDEK